MARHRSESNNFSVAGWVIAVFILAIALIAAAIWWFGFRQPEAPQAQECIQGDLNLPVAAEGVDATALIDDYNASDPVVRDFCITAELTDSVARAAVLLTPAGTDVAELLDGRSLSSTTPVTGADAHVLTPAGEVNEEQVRAATEFAKFHEDTTRPSETTTETTSEEAPAETTVEESPAPEAGPTDTLILFDTSAQSVPFHDAATDALAQLSLDLGAQGRQVAMWNYSSPLNPGVTQGWRTNVSFSDGTDAAAAVRLFGTGGVPQTRSAVVAAVGNAADHSRATGQPARVLLVTSGTAQDMDDAAFTAAFEQARGDADVTLEVVHVGDGEVDGALAGVGTLTEVTDPAQLPDAL
ncbi:hypothetical protein [Corynebacterium sp.]|uniref:hypothetical protein n=1 Tax=Corynebacterium sp. TaxID=1720 RepID=UPI0019B27DC1|nr:hypothetical protein [Corynebacterium sp.]HHU68057.1 hypothetical protein [Corynebacterium sp.]